MFDKARVNSRRQCYFHPLNEDYLLVDTVLLDHVFEIFKLALKLFLTYFEKFSNENGHFFNKTVLFFNHTHYSI